jgi:hypothetical protein
MEIVIFDTNAYRNLASDKNFSDLEKDIENFKSIEQKEGITALMHPIVIKELLYHVAGEKDSMHNKAVDSLKAMFLHCGDTKQFSILADFDLQLSNFFYKTTDPSRVRIDLQLGEIVSTIALKPIETALEKYQYVLKQIRTQISETEFFFKAQLKEFIKKIDPEAEDWTVFADNPTKRRKALAYFNSNEIENEIAIGYISLMHENLLSQNLITQDSKEELLKKANEFKEIFKAPITLYKEVLKKFIQPNLNFDGRSRENFVWDIHLMFTIGDHVVSATNSKIYLVTSDKEMKNAAAVSGFMTNTYTFPEYVEYITGRLANYEK